MRCTTKREVPTPLRFYKREWTRYRPDLPKSVSLPIFKLLPTDRPIFTCLQCGFINTLVPLCLWCSWTCEGAQREFERLTPRARRASTPPKIVRTLDQQGMANVPVKHPAIRSNKRNRRLADDPMLRPVSQERDQDCLSTRPSSHMKSHVLRDDWARPLIYVANATSCDSLSRHSCKSISQRCSSQDSDALFEKFPRPSWPGKSLPKSTTSSVNDPRYFRQLPHTPSPAVDRRSPVHLIKTISTKSLRSARIMIGLENLHEFTVPLKSNVDDSDNPAVMQALPTPKTLRRKKPLRLYQQSIPRSNSTTSSTFSASSLTVVSQQQSICTGDDSLSRLRYQTRLNPQAHARSCSQPTNFIRLGHPSRPLYTAIRPNMSSVKSTNDTSTHSHVSQVSHPSRPISLPTSYKAPSPGRVLLPTSPLDIDGVSIEPLNYLSCPLSHRSRGSVLRSALGMMYQRRDTKGFSLSGEIELRMALAASGGQDRHNAFRSKDMGKKRDGFNFMKRMRELKKGLKDLILRLNHR